MTDFLLEIGCEEIPAGYISPALSALAETMRQRLTDARIAFGGVETFGTPRRLSVRITDVADAQAAATTEVTGPPRKVAYDDAGNPTMAARKFAEKVGLDISALSLKQTDKGEYLCATVTESAVSTPEYLSGILADVILGLPFPKTMRWADLSISFARPIQSIVALFGSAVVPCTVGNISSGNQSFGHRFMAPGKLEIASPDTYEATLLSAHVIVNMETRKNAVLDQVKRAAEQAGGTIHDDPALLDTVTNLVETPNAVVGRFDTKFLELPPEVLITSMREHQKYFAVVDTQGRLMPCFIAVNNTRATDMALVARGHERVLRARLEDAMFFFRTDLEDKMDAWTEKLGSVLYQAKLGSIYDKVQRNRKLAAAIADALELGEDAKVRIDRAAVLAKSDLVSQMVFEFTNLQGIMGRVYARAAGEHAEVAAAIEEHYMPTHSGARLPASNVGAVVAIADKLDAICGCFSVGLIPTGASDPYALRRQSIGIVQILADRGFGVSLKSLISASVAMFSDISSAPAAETADAVYQFIESRLANLMVEEGLPRDAVHAATAISIDSIPDVWQRARALSELKKAADFEPVAAAFKRVANIMKKAADGDIATVDAGLFNSPHETGLHTACQAVQEKVATAAKSGRYSEALTEIATLRPAVDAFFDGVMVMDKDDAIRKNRLGLLKSVSDLFVHIADFSKLSA